MPTYVFRNKDNSEEFEEFMSISQKEKYLKENLNIEQIFTPSNIVSGVGDFESKTDNTWKEVLSKISEKHPGSAMSERYSKKTIKQVKTEQIIQKHLKRQGKI
jgi:hypothetical protein